MGLEIFYEHIQHSKINLNPTRPINKMFEMLLVQLKKKKKLKEKSDLVALGEGDLVG